MICGCGCGQKTPIARIARPERGYSKGQSQRFVHGHNRPSARNRPAYEGPIYEIDPETGCHVWQRGRTDGYGRLYIDRKPWSAHVLVWWCENGPPPDGYVVDHICRNRACMNIEHLRLATVAENGQNITSQGIRGASFIKHRGWRAQVYLGGKRHLLGYYATQEEAGVVAAEWRAQHMPFSEEYRARELAT